MKEENYISLPDLCMHYQIEMSFFNDLQSHGLLEVITVEKTYCILEDHVANVEKMVRLHKDLNLNYEGIDTVFNLLEKIENLKLELNLTRNKLRKYEDI
nr:chaperone modulator CbpM [uncultured Psychroserpens sp.]